MINIVLRLTAPALRSYGIRIPSAWPMLLRMKLMLFVLWLTIRPLVNPRNQSWDLH